MAAKQPRFQAEIIPAERIERRIYLLRQQKVMLSGDRVCPFFRGARHRGCSP